LQKSRKKARKRSTQEKGAFLAYASKLIRLMGVYPNPQVEKQAPSASLFCFKLVENASSRAKHFLDVVQQCPYLAPPPPPTLQVEGQVFVLETRKRMGEFRYSAAKIY
jgi:hypothetical protein